MMNMMLPIRAAAFAAGLAACSAAAIDPSAATLLLRQEGAAPPPPPPPPPYLEGDCSRRRDCHLVAPPCTFIRCFNRGKQGVSAKLTTSRRRPGYWVGTERCAEHCCAVANGKESCQGSVASTLTFGPGGNGTYSIDGLVLASDYRGDFSRGASCCHSADPPPPSLRHTARGPHQAAESARIGGRLR